MIESVHKPAQIEGGDLPPERRTVAMAKATRPCPTNLDTNFEDLFV